MNADQRRIQQTHSTVSIIPGIVLSGNTGVHRRPNDRYRPTHLVRNSGTGSLREKILGNLEKIRHSLRRKKSQRSVAEKQIRN
jgi:hypothetical protein